MSARDFHCALAKLSRASCRNFMDPACLPWPESVAPESWCFTPELVSLHGTPAWEALDEAARKRLSFFEAVNFFSLNIHGEKQLISEIGRRLYRGEHRELSRYLLHLVDEEAKHMMCFAGFCGRYAGKVYPDRTLQLTDEPDPDVATYLLFARIYVFEEIVDEFNLALAVNPLLVPIVREINRIHHIEEARHLAFGRKYLAEMLPVARRDTATLARVRAGLEGYINVVWKQYHNPIAYRDAGVPDPFNAWRTSFDHPACCARRERISARRLGLLRGLGLLEGTA